MTISDRDVMVFFAHFISFRFDSTKILRKICTMWILLGGDDYGDNMPSGNTKNSLSSLNLSTNITKYGTSVRNFVLNLHYIINPIELVNQCVQWIFLPGDWAPSFRKLITNHVYIYRYLFNELYVNRAKKTVRIRFLFSEVPLKAKKVLIENRAAASESERINDFKRWMNTFSIR